MIRFNCSECNRTYRVSDKYANKRVRCKDCGGINRIPPMDNDTVAKVDSVAAYNNLLKELAKAEKTAPIVETTS